MHWRRSKMPSRRLRKIFYIVTVSLVMCTGIYTQFGGKVSNTYKTHSNLISTNNQALSPKTLKLNKRDSIHDPNINRKFDKFSSAERVSNVRYVTLGPFKKTNSILTSSKNLRKESYELKRAREGYKHVIRGQFQYTQMSFGNKEAYNRNFNKVRSRNGQYKLVKTSVGKSSAFIKGSIRFYSKPIWFSAEDIDSMVILSGTDIMRVNSAELYDGIRWNTLMFPKDDIKYRQLERTAQQSNLVFYRGLTSSLLSVHEVLAFHLDRVLGIGRALPTVAKHIKSTSASTLNISENTLQSIIGIDSVDIQSVDGLTKQDILECKSIQFASNKCGNIDGVEWGKLALFDFLLQIHNRLNKHCCGFQPESKVQCLITIAATAGHCSNVSSLNMGIVYKTGNNNQLIFLKNDMDLKSSGNSTDFEILRGIRKFPARAVDIIRKGKLRLMLLQSLFIDKAYWDGVGGRPGIDKILNVITERAKLFVEYYDTQVKPTYRLLNET